MVATRERSSKISALRHDAENGLGGWYSADSGLEGLRNEKRSRLSCQAALLRLGISCECTEPPGSRSGSTAHRVKQFSRGNVVAGERPDT